MMAMKNMMIMKLTIFKLTILLFVGVMLFTPSAQSMDVEKAEYLRLKVISNTLYDRAISDPDWDKLVRPTWLNFRQIMKEFLIETLEANQSKASPPAGIVSPRIIWQDYPAGPKIVEFNQVPEPWFHLQASLINEAMAKLEILMDEDDKNAEALIAQFEIIKDAVLNMPKPPFVKPKP